MNLLKISKSEFFSGHISPAKGIKRKNKRGFIDLKSVCIEKDINKMKRQLTLRKNISESNISDKGLISNIYWINTPQNKEPIKIQAENCIDIFPKRAYRWPAVT